MEDDKLGDADNPDSGKVLGVEGLPQIQKDVMDGYTGALKSAARVWFALVTLTIIVLTRKAPVPMAGTRLVGASDIKPMTLPFQLGEVDATTFFVLTLLIIALLYVAFAAAQAQSQRARMLIESIAQALSLKPFAGQIYAADVFDAMVPMNPNRVAPLAQRLRGKWEFSPESCPKSLLYLSNGYYLLLKLVSVAVYLLLPLWGAVHAAQQWQLSGGNKQGTLVPEWAIAIGVSVCALVAIQMVVTEIFFIVRALRAASRGRRHI